MVKPVSTSPPLPFAGRGMTVQELASFDQDLAKALYTYLGDIAKRANDSLPKDGSEPMEADLDMGGFDINNAGTINATTYANLPVASTTQQGIVELATDAETLTGTDTARAVTPANVASVYRILLSTPQATTSGTTKDFTIPAGVKRVSMHLTGVSISGTDTVLIQLADTGTIRTSGYNNVQVNTSAGATGAAVGPTSSFRIASPAAASVTMYGTVVLSLMDASTNTWALSSQLADVGGTRFYVAAGTMALSGTMDRVRLLLSGANTFDAGSVNVSVEY